MCDNSLVLTALAPLGFNLKTKALYSVYRGNLKGYNKLVNTLISLGENSDDAKVWAVMLLNYKLNGSYPNLGQGLFSRVWALEDTCYPLEKRVNGYNNFKNSVKPKTYNRWFKALNVVNKVLEIKALTA